MTMNKDALEGMATILRENGYEVTLKKSKKKPYVSDRFNKISDLDLTSLSTATCLFIDGFAFNDIEEGDYVVSSSSATIGYLNLKHDGNTDEVIIQTNRADSTDPDGYYITEKLKKCAYVIKLKDVIKLMVDNEDYGE